MEEVEFYERQGLVDEALLAVLGSSPRPTRAIPRRHRPSTGSQRLAALEEGRSRAPARRVRSADAFASLDAPSRGSRAAAEPNRGEYGPGCGSTGHDGDLLDLGAELSAELGPELTPTPTGGFQYSVADVFDQFKRGLEKTVRPDDSATKYSLGIAFQEMGMLDEALEQFRSALAGGDRRRDAEES